MQSEELPAFPEPLLGVTKPRNNRRRWAIRIALIGGGIAFVVFLLIPSIEKVYAAKDRVQSSNNLAQIGLAIHAYDGAQGRLPPQAICDKDGNKLLSWRVAILPYVECSSEYPKFNHDEPWDSSYNMAQVSKMPKIFAKPGEDPRTGKTHIKLFSGEGTPFEMIRKDEENSSRSLWSIESLTYGRRGASNLIFCIEAGDPVIWTKPEDWDYAPEQPLPDLKPIYRDGFMALMGDRRVMWIRKNFKESAFRASIDPKSTSKETLD